VQFPQLIVGFVRGDMVGTARTCEARVRAIYAKWRVSQEERRWLHLYRIFEAQGLMSKDAPEEYISRLIVEWCLD
jgi:hypothetical protein